MSQDASKPHSQHLEQVIATVFTCRSVVKYNLVLSEEQKFSLLDDIDSALDILRAQMISSSPLPIKEKEAESDAGELVSPHIPGKISLIPYAPETPKESAANDTTQILQALYRLYHAYVDAQQGTNINTFVTRFNDVMTTINDIQQFIQARFSSYDDFVQQLAGSQGSQDDPLDHLRVFVADIYYIFMEFVRVLSETLQQNNVCLDTEKLSTTQSGSQSGGQVALIEPRSGSSEDLFSLHQIYENYHRLAAMKGYMADRITESTAFLEFIKDRVGIPAHKREEVTVQFANVTTLLTDLANLLAEYEKTTSFLLYRSM